MAWIQLPLTRQGFIYSRYRGLKPTAKVIRPQCGRRVAEHVEATAKTGETIRLGMVAVRIVDGVVKNKYANDVGKLAAWTSASHVEKSPKKKDPTP